MARKPLPAAESSAIALNQSTLAADTAALDTLTERSRAVAELYGDGLAYDRHRVIHEARFYMAQSAEAMLEAGKRLIQIKENEPHGEFVGILESQLSISPRTAQVMMQAAAKYLMNPALAAKAQTSALLGVGRSKLLELMAEPDEAIEALADGGTIAGLNLDDVDAMTVRELRAALRESREARGKDVAAKDKVIGKKEAKITELEEQLARRDLANADEQAQLDTLREVGLAAEMAVRRLVAEAAQVTGAPTSEAAGLAAQQAVAFVAQLFASGINEAGLDVDFAEMTTPHWLQAVPKADAPRRGGKAN